MRATAGPAGFLGTSLLSSKSVPSFTGRRDLCHDQQVLLPTINGTTVTQEFSYLIWDFHLTFF